MSDAERIQRLEALVGKLTDALLRKGTEKDGNWGWPSFHAELREIKSSLEEGS